jgi:hypothetical protein
MTKNTVSGSKQDEENEVLNQQFISQPKTVFGITIKNKEGCFWLLHDISNLI